MNNSVYLRLESVTVDYPVYSATTRSLKNRLLRTGTGGHIEQTAESGLCVRAIENVNLALEHGNRVGLIGPNGAGKSTLLRVLAGVYEPTLGAVQSQGRIASLLNVSLGIDPEATGYENIRLRGLLFGLTSEDVRARTEDIADFTELGDYLEMPVYTYSAGMKVRLALGVCTCINPDILLMDEWIGVSDATFVEKARRRLQEFVGRAGILVLASHNHQLLERVCDIGVWLDAGRIKSHGPIQDVLREYKSAKSS